MTHAWTLREDTLCEVEMRLQYGPDEHFDTQTGPKLFNAQLKGWLSELHRKLVSDTLERLQTLIKHSDAAVKWPLALITLIVLCITAESFQATTLCKEHSYKKQGLTPADNDDARVALQRSDKCMDFLILLFRKIYHQKSGARKRFNPVTNVNLRKSELDANAQEFAATIEKVLHDHRK